MTIVTYECDLVWIKINHLAKGHFVLKLECGLMPNVMAALPIPVAQTRSENSVLPFLVPRRKVWLTPRARLLCNNVANIRERKTWTQSECFTWQNSVRGKSSRKRIYTVIHKKTWQYICDHNSGKYWRILIIFTYLEAGMNALCRLDIVLFILHVT